MQKINLLKQCIICGIVLIQSLLPIKTLNAQCNVANTPFSASCNGCPTTATYTLGPTTTGFMLDVLTLDNSFNISINGTRINNRELEFEYLTSQGTTVTLPEFVSDGGIYNSTGIVNNPETANPIWNMTGTAANPLLRIIIDLNGNTTLFGSRVSGGPLFPMRIRSGFQGFNTITWNTTANNTVTITQAGRGPTNMRGLFIPIGLSTPVLSTNNINNACNSNTTTLSLAGLVTNTCTPGSVLQWHTVATNFSNSTLVPNSTSVGNGTYYPVCFNSATNCYGLAANPGVTATIILPPVAPSYVYCQGATASQLTATATSGSTLRWYTVPSGGTFSTTAPTPSTTNAGTTTYYVSQMWGTTCETNRTPVTVTVNAKPNAPTASGVTYCQSATATPLSASGTNLLWYTTATGGTGSTTAPTPSTLTPGTTNYYVSQTANGCESNRTTIAVVVKPTPAAPVSNSVEYCQGATASPLVATATGGAILQWYTVATGGIASTTAPTPSTSSVGSTTYYVSQLLDGCESTRTAVGVLINPSPSLSLNSNTSICPGSKTSITAVTSGGTPAYTYALDNGAFQSGNIFSGIGQGTYVITVRDNKSCTNSQSITITQNDNLSLVTEVSYACTLVNNGVITAYGASTQGAVTYNLNGGTFGSNNVFSNLAPGSYTVGVRDMNCTITNTVNVNTVMDLALSLTSQNNCIVGNTGTITVSASGGLAPYSYNINGGVFGGSATFIGLAAGTHTITVKDARDCLQSLVVTITEKPSAPNTSSTTICLGSSTTLSSTCLSGSPMWYSNSELTAVLPSTTVSPTSTTTYYATCEITSLDCKSTSTSSLVTVNPVPTVNAVSNRVLCKGSTITDITFTGSVTGTVFSWTNSNVGIGLSAGGIGDISSFSAENNGTGPIVSTITVTPIYTNNGVSCSGASRSFTITVNPSPKVDDIANQIVCNGQSTTLAITGAATSYNWSYTSANIGLASSGTLASSGSNASASTTFTAVNNTNAPLDATVMVTPTFVSGGLTCTGTPEIFTITVNHTPTVDFVNSQVKCNNTFSDAINFSGNNALNTYDWSHTNITIGLTGSGSGDIPSFAATNTGTSPNLSVFAVTPKFINGGTTCVGIPRTFDFTVNHTPTVDLVSSQVKCNNTSTDAINFSGNSPSNSFAWSHSNTSIGIGSVGTGNIASFTATNSTSNPITSNFSVTPSYTNGGITCYGPNRSFSITVNQTPILNVISDQARCNTNTTNAINLTGNNPSNVYNWSQTNTAVGLNAGTGSGNISSFVATNTGATSILSSFTVTPSFTNAGLTCIGSDKTFTISVHPTPQATITPSSLNICSGDNVNMTISDAKPVSGTSTYAWNRNNSSNISGLISGTNNTINGTLTNNTNSTQTTIFTGTVTSQFGCTNSTTAAVNVTPPLSVTISGNEYFCGTGSLNNTSLLTAVPSGGSGTYTYQWNLNGSPISGATNLTYAAGVVGDYDVTVTSEYCTKTSSKKNVQSYNLNAAPTVTPNPVTLCGGGTVTFTASSTSTLGTFNWYADATSTTALGTGSTFTTPSISSSSTFYASRSFIILGSNPLVTCETSRTPAEVIINTSVPTPIISASSTTICSGSSSTLSNSSSCTGAVTWRNSSSALVGTGNSITVTPTSTITYTATCTEGSCSSTSTPLQISVNTISAGTIQKGLTNQTGCSPLDPNITGVTTAASGAGTLSYSWQQSTDGGSNWAAAVGQINLDGSQFNPNPFATTTRFRRIVTSTLNGVTCSAISNELEYVVDPNPVLSTISTNPSASVCIGTSITLSASASGGTPNYTFRWEKGSTTVGGNSNSFMIASTSVSDAGTYSLTVTDSKGCKDIAQRTINILSSIGGVVSSNTTVLCNGANNGSVTLSGHTGSVVNWQFSINNGTSWVDIANTSTTQSYTNLTTTTQYRAVVKNGSCSSATSLEATITVPASLTLTAAPSNLSCNNNASGTVILTASGGVPSYQFALNGGINQASNTFSGLSAGTFSFSVRDANGCVNSINNVVVGQPADLVATFSSIKPSCPGGSNGSIRLETLVGGTSIYQFNIDGGTYQSISSIPIVLSGSLTSGNYTVNILDSKSCLKSYNIIIPNGVDITPPTIACPANITVSCSSIPLINPTVSDDCDNNPSVTMEEVRTDGTCANSYTLTRTWTATDVSGNKSTCIQVITVEDKTAPVLSTAPANVTVSCEAVPTAAVLTATDNCDTAPVVTYAEARTNGTCANS
ncbi:Ig-like domain-containing protein, partial [Lacihabitans soyangensis]